ncbi:DUF3267 domain-containing protein [Natronococcus sp. A-GB7]|uniref:DUF3267 domain-containing protein n=1 Tax=Natronococcus sp. A-GB7 TaxID=3037649 RepID=UPI00241BF60D|nr:DUF3267 domain-containing protein [Natronococcus sp. A-GB7]MDG5817277.1 DUF3267 domain-containing protein [Natronococcus sp. A-GB7]
MSVATPNGTAIDDAATEEPIETVRLTRSSAVGLVLVSVVGFFASAYAFGAALAAIHGASLEPIVLSTGMLSHGGPALLVAIGLGVLSVVAHELVHGLFMARYGDSPSYGIGVSVVFPYAYARGGAASYGRNQLLVVLLAPLVIGTTAGLVAMAIRPSPIWLVPLAVNAAGSVGDLWMALALWRYPAEVRVGDHPRADARGFGIYAPAGPNGSERDRTERLPGREFLSRTAVGAAATAVALAAVLVGLVFRSLAVDTGTVVVDLGGWTLLRHELHTGIVVLEIGARYLAAIALGGGLAWAIVGTLAKP